MTEVIFMTYYINQESGYLTYTLFMDKLNFAFVAQLSVKLSQFQFTLCSAKKINTCIDLYIVAVVVCTDL